MSTPLAMLPMYDWPETRTANDFFWDALKSSLQDYGFDAPPSLTRRDDPMSVWLDNNLLLSQTCGLPYKLALREEVSIVGAPAYGIDCGAGSYFSVIIASKASELSALSEIKNACFGFNGPVSQSGLAAFLYQLKTEGIPADAIARGVQTGSHRRSIQMVVDGSVDVAALDAVSWELAKRHEPVAKNIRLIGRTTATPGLPFITHKRPKSEVRNMHLAVIDAMASLDETTRDELLLMGFAELHEADYDIIERRYNDIAALAKAITTP